MTIQELDGSFNHTFKIEENKTKFEITCHSKSRRCKYNNRKYTAKFIRVCSIGVIYGKFVPCFLMYLYSHNLKQYINGILQICFGICIVDNNRISIYIYIFIVYHI